MKHSLTFVTLLMMLTLATLGQTKMTTTKSGLQYLDQKVGTGTTAVKGMTVDVHYTGWFYKDGKKGAKFDSSLDRGEPISFKLGNKNVIAGWDEGIEGMKVGGKRDLIIPPNLAYGEAGHPGGIPPNSTLTFEVELVKASK